MVKTPGFQTIRYALEKGVKASERWHDLSTQILNHTTELCKDGRWLQLPEFERQWLTSMVESLKVTASQALKD